MSNTKRVRCGQRFIAYDERGEGPALILLMGLAWPRTYWDEGFCDLLAGSAFRVIRMDARDVGESDFGDETPPNIGKLVQAAFAGEAIDAPYRLTDMADDVIAFMDALVIGSAHVVGSSLGGMVAQTLAIEHSHRVRSLTCVMTSTGDHALPLGTPEAMEILFTPIPADRSEAIEHQVASFRLLGGPSFDEARARDLAACGFDVQAHVPPALRQLGAARQLAALLSGGSRVDALRDVTIPSLVVHGVLDPLVPIEAGRQIAKLIPDARLLELEDMGHDLTPPHWDAVVAAIAAIAAIAR